MIAIHGGKEGRNSKKWIGKRKKQFKKDKEGNRTRLHAPAVRYQLDMIMIGIPGLFVAKNER